MPGVAPASSFLFPTCGRVRLNAFAPPQQKPPEHTPLTQSLPMAQRCPASQRAQDGSAPPQSTAVSVPLVTPSPQEMQTLSKQLLLMQSEACVHASRSAQRGQRSPPQSVSVSRPLRAPSEHEPGSLQRSFWQKPLWHWTSAVQRLPRAHRPQATFPQSTTGSSPFITPSVQLGSWQHRSPAVGQPPPQTAL